MLWRSFRQTNWHTQIAIVVVMLLLPLLTIWTFLGCGRELGSWGADHVARLEEQKSRSFVAACFIRSALYLREAEAKSPLAASVVRFLGEDSSRTRDDSSIDSQSKMEYSAMLAFGFLLAWLTYYAFVSVFLYVLRSQHGELSAREDQMQWRAADSPSPEFAEYLLFTAMLPDDAAATSQLLIDQYEEMVINKHVSIDFERWYFWQVALSLPRLYWVSLKKCLRLRKEQQEIS